jgi:hypothetical protein
MERVGFGQDLAAAEPTDALRRSRARSRQRDAGERDQSG